MCHPNWECSCRSVRTCVFRKSILDLEVTERTSIGDKRFCSFARDWVEVWCLWTVAPPILRSSPFLSEELVRVVETLSDFSSKREGAQATLPSIGRGEFNSSKQRDEMIEKLQEQIGMHRAKFPFTQTAQRQWWLASCYVTQICEFSSQRMNRIISTGGIVAFLWLWTWKKALWYFILFLKLWRILETNVTSSEEVLHACLASAIWWKGTFSK